MFKSHGFNGYLTKYQPKTNREGMVEIKMTVVHEVEGDMQTFLNSLDTAVSIPGKFKHYFEPTIIFDEIKFKTELGVKANMRIERSTAFEPFPVRLDEVKVSRKIKEGIDVCTYTMQFTKEISEGNIDISIAGAYLNAKRPDDEGREKKVTFNFKLNVIED